MRARAVAVGGLLLVLALYVGAVVLWLEPTEVGWFAYAGSASEPALRVFVMTARRDLALVLAALGLLTLGSLIGFVLGRRQVEQP